MGPYILLTVDSLRSDCVNRDFLRNSLGILEEDYATFSNAISYGVATPFAFPGIIAGTHPVGDGNIPESATTLAEGIPGESVGYSNNGHLRSERGYDRGFDRFEDNPQIGDDESRSLKRSVVNAAKQIDFIRNSDLINGLYGRYLREPLPSPSFPAPDMVELIQTELSSDSCDFVWGHWMDPHTPYHPDTAIGLPDEIPDLSTLDDIHERIIRADASALSDAEIQLAKSLYHANIRYFDKHFANLLSWLKDQSWYDDAFIAIVSDHGEYFGEHGQLFHTWDIDPYDEAIRTPLWIKYPDQADGGAEFNHLVGHGDIVATVDTLSEDISLSPPEHTAPLRRETDRHVVSVSNTSKRLTETDGSYIVRRDGTERRNRTVSASGTEFLSTIEYPECVNSKGEAQGVEEAERQRRLQQLGYR